MMLKHFLRQDERIDWFRVIVDLQRKGVSMAMMGKDLGIPPSTIKGWRLEIARPKAEDGIRVLAYWAYKMDTTIEHLPRVKAGAKELRQTERSCSD